MTTLKTITLGELKLQLGWVLDLPDDTEITFGAGDLSFYRPKTALYDAHDIPKRVQIQFNELYSVTFEPVRSARTISFFVSMLCAPPRAKASRAIPSEPRPREK